MQICRETGCARAGRHSGFRRLSLGAVIAGDAHGADCVREYRRPGRRRLRREHGAARRQRHRFHPVRIQFEREMAGTSQGNRTWRNGSVGPPGPRHHRRYRPIFAVIQSVASSIGVDVGPVNLRDAGEIERAVTAFARSANGGRGDCERAVARSQRADPHSRHSAGTEVPHRDCSR
jgi:hypothetical protein